MDHRTSQTYILHTELAYGVVHQDGEVLDGHADVPVGPAALVRPVLVALVLERAGKPGTTVGARGKLSWSLTKVFVNAD